MAKKETTAESTEKKFIIKNFWEDFDKMINKFKFIIHKRKIVNA